MKPIQKSTLHDLANLLMRVNIHAGKGNCGMLKKTLPLTLECFESLRQSLVLETLVPKTISFKLRLIDLLKNKKNLEEAYNLIIEVDHSKCPEDLEFISNLEAVQAISSNLIQNSSKAGASHLWIEYIANPRTFDVIYRDNGKGMSEKELQEIGFGYSTNNGGQGVSLLRKVVSDIGGTITWRSIPKVGTEVKLNLIRYLGL